MPPAFFYTDGGRAQAGFSPVLGDCVCRAIAIAAKTPYAEVYRGLAAACRQERKRRSWPDKGVLRRTITRYMRLLAWEWVPTSGQGPTLRLTAVDPPPGRLVLIMQRHAAALIDRVIYDIAMPPPSAPIYGYYRRQT
jgi:hypothetical protein